MSRTFRFLVDNSSFRTKITRYLFGISRSYSSNVSLLQHLQSRIKANGPITVAEYMKQVLVNPAMGYYINKDVFGTKGDFITSPEISQMFGELVGIWFVNEWMQIGSPSSIQVVELGPGRGTMADDMLRVFSKFPQMKESVTCHLVEVSPTLADIQQRKLTGSTGSGSISSDTISGPFGSNEPHYYKSCKSKYGPEVFWYRSLSDVPREKVSGFIAHEFFDALPIHKFQKTQHGWREVLVDFDLNKSSLSFVLSPTPTAATVAYLKMCETDERNHIEVSPEAGVVVQELADRIQSEGGFALIADYGHNGDKTDTFRGFKNHKLHDVLVEPGSADLTADVDFSYLTKMAGKNVKTFGPVTQNEFLHNMGIGVRLQMLLQNATLEARKDLISGYKMLTSPDQMGERFKFLAILQHRGQDYNPAGFTSLQ
ncbi:hypothetical protein CHS0354_013816 [Potamilus streckersoni]|uniref:Protein arginine methyltransferase NDUFAF7 n=2 Tax=Potamilus streckersoni TaxID=2493646 RepID=A0AAE0VWD2_9BIVA|nr:hypothetical protein CHS0354_013816 [Potamilus streckersoni]